MEKERQQIYYSSKFTQVLSAQTSYFSLPSALLYISVRATSLPLPEQWPNHVCGVQHQERGVCLCVPFCWCCVQPEPDPRAAETASHRTSQPPLALECHTLQFSALIHVLDHVQTFLRLSPHQTTVLVVTMVKVVCPCLRHATDQSLVLQLLHSPCFSNAKLQRPVSFTSEQEWT